MPSDDIAISVRNLTKSYRLFGHPGDRIKQFLSLGLKRYHREFTALKDVSFDIRKGETVGIIGRNGSGKSTLLQLICGILKPTEGTVKVNGRISALLELGAGFNPEFTGRENVYFQGALTGLTKTQVDERFDDVASFADIGEFIDQPVRTYSSGMFVRLAFAAMIHADADVLVIDEALAVGDEAFQRRCFEKLNAYLDGGERILFFVSHNLRQIERLCSRVLWLNSGNLRMHGCSTEVCASYLASNDLSHDELGKTTPQPNIAYSGEVEVRGLSLIPGDDTVPCSVLKQHSSLRLIIDFTCNSQILGMELIAGFQAPDSTFIAAASTLEQLGYLDISVGDHSIECRFKHLPLLPGTYHVRLAFRDKHFRPIWVGHKQATFRIDPLDTKRAMRTPDGLIEIPFSWVLSATDHSIATSDTC